MSKIWYYDKDPLVDVNLERSRGDKPGDLAFVFLEDWDFYYKGKKYTVPKGYTSDGASIPKIAQVVYPPARADYLYAAFCHDLFYTFDWRIKHELETGHMIKRSFADGLLRDAMIELGAEKVRANIFYTAVRMGGWTGWNK